MKPKVSSGYLTPQPSKKKEIPKNKSGTTENINGICEINEDIFQNLMSDPLKRQLILNILSSEKHKIDAYKKSLEKKNQGSPFHKTLKKPCESPTALHRRRVLQQQKCAQSSDSNSESGSSRPTSRQSEASSVPSPVRFDNILDGVVAFVEVKSGSRDRSEAVRSLLRGMGAVVREKFTNDVTHVIFKDGLYTTYQKANLMNVHLVSVLWLEACKTSRIKVSEKKYPAIGTSVFDHNVSTLCSQMQKDYEEIIHEEFQRSIQTGTPLPSTKSLIDRRRTLMTPNSMEVANITRGAQKAGSSATRNSSCMFDDDSDVHPLIDGDIIERGSDIFEDFSNKRNDPGKKNKSKLSHTNNTTEDMDLTDIQGDELLWTSKENLSPNKKTPKINSEVKNSNIQSVDLLVENLYRRQTNKLNDSNTEEEEEKLTPRTARIFNKNKLTPEDSKTELTPITPRSVHIFSKNVSCRTNIEKPVGTSDSNLTNMSVLKLPEKSSSMSSLRISENSNTNINQAKNSQNSTKFGGSYSPIKSNIIDNILEKLQDSLNTSNKKSSESNYESCNSLDDSNLETPNKNVTLRKKSVKHVGRDEAVREYEQDMFSSSITEDEDVENLEITEDGDVRVEQEEQRTRTTLNKKFGERKTESSATGKLLRRKNTNEEVEDVENAAGTVGEERMSGPSLILSKKNVVGRNRSSAVRNLFVEVKTNEISNSQNSKKQRRHTVGSSKTLQKNEEEKRVNTRKTSLEKSVENSPAKKLKLTPPKEINEDLKNSSSIRRRRQTMSSSILNSDSEKQLRICMSSTDLDANKDSPGKKKYRRLYTPTDFKELAVSDEKEREEKRKAKKKKSKSGLFIKPTIFTQKEKAIVVNPTENLEQSTRKSNKKTIDNKSEKQYNSDEDEQVELKKEILNKKNNICDETPTKTIPVSSKASKTTPRQSKRILSIKTTSIFKSQRRSSLEFQSLNQSTKKRLKIDAVKKPSIVCTKMHRQEVQMFTQIVETIGGFDVEDEVSEKTTHLVAGEPKRTINMLRALSMGCWILKKEWLYRSLESGKWLPEEDFEETDFSTAVQKNRLQRQAFGPSFSSDIFQDYGPIYVAKGSIPRCSDLRELIQMCKGRITASPRSASIVVGESVKYKGVTCVKETWILDCISQNKKYPLKKYIF